MEINKMKKLMILTMISSLMMVFSGSVSAQKVSREYSGTVGPLVGQGFHFLPRAGDEIKIDLLTRNNGDKYISIYLYKPSIPISITATMNSLPQDKNYVMPTNRGTVKTVDNSKKLALKPNDTVKVTFFENESKMIDVEIIRGGKSQGKMRFIW